MKKIVLMLFMMSFVTYAQAAAKPCEELKEEIAAKIDAKGVPSYTLTIVPINDEAEGKEVGTCDGGTKKIMYVRG